MDEAGDDVTFGDQEKINEFGRLNNRLMEIRAEVIQTKNDPRRKAKSEALAKRVVDELAMLDDEPSPLRKPSPAAKHVARRSPVAGRAQQRKQERNRHVAEAKKAPASFVPADELSD